MTFDTNFDAAFDSPAQDIDETTALLIRARGFLERGWCQKAYARDAEGKDVWPTDNVAVAWCAAGALEAAIGVPDDGLNYRRPPFRRLIAVMNGDIACFNDRQQTVEPVLAAFDRAISQGT